MSDQVSSIRFPAMRQEVLSALESLSDRNHQAAAWGRHDRRAGRYDDLTLNVHILYDDCQVLPDPQTAVGAVLLAGETARLRHLHKALNPLLEDLGDSSDAVYLADPRWPSVVHAARSALDGMRNPPAAGTP
ncbi:MAG: SCO4402 family protein [Pseudonocardia sp.]